MSAATGFEHVRRLADDDEMISSASIMRAAGGLRHSRTQQRRPHAQDCPEGARGAAEGLFLSGFH